VKIHRSGLAVKRAFSSKVPAADQSRADPRRRDTPPGNARDYVEAQWLMLQQPRPQDYVIATGRQHSVRDFVERAAACLGMRIEWRGSGAQEVGIDTRSGNTVVRIDPRYFRPTEVDTLLGHASKARVELGWAPRIGFDELVREMVDADLARRARAP
jgi:GDPmannose 4,6-dehydratase